MYTRFMDKKLFAVCLVLAILISVCLSAVSVCAEDSYLLRYKTGLGKTVRYRIKMDSQIENQIEMPGMPSQMTEIVMQIDMRLSQKTVGISSSGSKVDIRIDRMNISPVAMKLPGGQSTVVPIPTDYLNEMKNFSVPVMIDSRGRVKLDQDTPSQLTFFSQQLGLFGTNEMFGNMGIEYPEQSVKIGETWRVKTPIMPPGLSAESAEAEVSYTLAAIEECGGVECAKITSNPDIMIGTLKFDLADMMSQMFDFTGAGAGASGQGAESGQTSDSMAPSLDFSIEDLRIKGNNVMYVSLDDGHIVKYSFSIVTSMKMEMALPPAADPGVPDRMGMSLENRLTGTFAQE